MERHRELSPWRKRLLPYLGILLVLTGGIACTEYVARLAAHNAEELNDREALARLSELRARIESEINSVLYLTRGLTAYIVTRPDASQRELEAVAAHIVSGSRHIRNIGLAPDNVVSFVYPLEGNEQALGLDYARDPVQWPAIRRAIEQRDTLVAGPLKLVQGGMGLIARTPIFVDTAGGQRYWGMASIVIDTDSVFRTAGLYDETGGPLAIRGIDGLGARDGHLWGAAGVFESERVLTQVVSFRRNWWQLGLVPRLEGMSAAAWRVRALSYGLLLAVITLLVELVRLFKAAEASATRDALTGLPNRRLLLERSQQLIALSERSGISFGLCYIDLNGFKPVNDHFGHDAGDWVLREVARRLKSVLRRTDTLARTGGDEFVVLLPMLAGTEEVRHIHDKLTAVLDDPIPYRQHRIEIGASLGSALYPAEAATLDELMALADSRMYGMKAASKSA